MTEADLADLLSFFRCEGEYARLGGGLVTYPMGSGQSRELHDGCLELERRRLVYRFADQCFYVAWAPLPWREK